MAFSGVRCLRGFATATSLGGSAPLYCSRVTLDDLLGSWTISMRHVQMADAVAGRQRYERVLDGAFVMLDWTFEHPDFPNALALLQDGALHYFDVRGVTRTFDLAFTTAGCTMIRKDPDFWQRCSVAQAGPHRMTGTGENSHDEGATWVHDFAITYDRVG